MRKHLKIWYIMIKMGTKRDIQKGRKRKFEGTYESCGSVASIAVVYF